MAQPSEPKPVKLFFAILFSDEEKLQKAIHMLSQNFGEMDHTSPVFEFSETNYYRDEMGEKIQRIFLSARRLIMPDEIVDAKKRTYWIENSLSVEGKRRVNIDPGYIDYNKVVLATHKGGGCKVYLREGVWADIMLRYEKGTFKSFPWTFPDFSKGTYFDVLLAMRRIYKEQLNTGA